MIQLTDKQAALLTQLFHTGMERKRQVVETLLLNGECQSTLFIACHHDTIYSFWSYIKREQPHGPNVFIYVYTLDRDALFADKKFLEAVERMEQQRRVSIQTLSEELDDLTTFRTMVDPPEPKENKTEPTDFI